MAYKPTRLTPAEAGTGAINTASSGKILIGDGTNYVSSTPNYPTAAGASGNVLTSNGTNWISSPPSGGSTLLVASGTLTSAQIKALHATPITAIAAQGAGTVVVVLFLIAKTNYGGSNVFTAGAGQSINLFYNIATFIQSAANNSQLISTTSQVTWQPCSIFNAIAYTAAENSPVRFYNTSATEISGNAANNNTMPWEIIYRVVTI